MLVLAISKQGAEFLYKASTAHKVSKASADKIAEALNASGYMLKAGEVWHKHEVYLYGSGANAAAYAEGQAFTIRRGVISRRR